MPEQTTWSLRRRLLLISAFGMIMALTFGGIAMFWAASVENRQIVDARLEQLGATMLSLVENGLADQSPVDPSTFPLKTRPASAMLYRYQLWAKDGRLLLRSHEASADTPIVELNHLGFETRRIGGDVYRVFALPTKDGGTIQVAECLDEASLPAAEVTAYYVVLLMIPLGIVFCLSWAMTRRSLRSVDSLAGELRRRNPLDVTRLDIERPPQELLPILNALDLLFTRVGHAISVERRFTSVAAHEMRTPLAGLRAQAQIASTAATHDEARVALNLLMQGVDRTAHMVDQLLDLARVEALSKDAALFSQPVRVAEVFRSVMTDLASRASAKRIEVLAQFEVPDFHCVGFGLHLILRNLLANAILYCPPGRRVCVATTLQGSDTVLTVDDSGPGIAQSDREYAFERFNRLGQNKADGVGLGLSIVLLIVELHGAKIQLLDSPIGGLRVRLSFPQPNTRRRDLGERHVEIPAAARSAAKSLAL
jgi:signal transduction histidine kinase